MDRDMPTLHGLSKPQKRALLLRDKLRYMDTSHLDEHIHGLEHHEPPKYRLVNGRILPRYANVTLKENATCFDLGNVLFQDERSGSEVILRACLMMENGRVGMRTMNMLPFAEQDLDSVPIYAFIAKTMEPMFEVKYEALQTRIYTINNIRRAAYDLVYQQAARYRYKEVYHTHTVLDIADELHKESIRSLTPPALLIETNQGVSGKRRQVSPIARHTANKRSKVGLDTIPDTVKSAVIDEIPEKVKVDLFENVVTIAFPSFDNLMTAAWNVVTVYSNVGTDFPDLHNAIGDLESVLEASDESLKSRATARDSQLNHARQDARPKRQPVLEQVHNTQSPRASSAHMIAKSATPLSPTFSRFQGLTEEGHDLDLDLDETLFVHDDTTRIQPEPAHQELSGRRYTTQEISKALEENEAQNATHQDDLEQEIRRPAVQHRVQQPYAIHAAPTTETPAARQPSTQVRSDEVSAYHIEQENGFDQEHGFDNDQTPSTIEAPSLPKATTAPERAKSTELPQRLQPALEAQFPRSSLPPQPFAPGPPTQLPRQHSVGTGEKRHLPGKPRDLSAFTLQDLKDKYKARKLSLVQTYGNPSNIPKMHKQHMSQIWLQIKKKEDQELQDSLDAVKKRGMCISVVDDMVERLEDREGTLIGGTDGGMAVQRLGTAGGGFGAAGGGGGLGLGNSILGRKKTEGKVPVAVMVHKRI